MFPDEKRAAQHYKAMEIKTAPQYKRVIMLHEEVIKNISVALTKDAMKRRVFLRKAQGILTELMRSIKFATGDIAKNLYYLYEFVYGLLIRGINTDCNSALEIMEGLTETFRKISYST